MPELCVSLHLGSSTEGARRPRRRTQNRADPACASTRSPFRVVDMTADVADVADKREREKIGTEDGAVPDERLCAATGNPVRRLPHP